MKQKLLCLLLGLVCSYGPLPARDFKVENSQFMLDGKPVQLICGEMHYPRIAQEYWRDRIRRAKAMGINTISTYVFWNIHERRPGVFDFSGQADLAKFIRIAGEEGMFVVLRPGPYVCAEWDFGGYPYWLQKNKDMVWRSDNPAFLSACQRYIERLGKELSDLTVTNGGPIVLVQVENEYGSYGNDRTYLGKLRDMIISAGFNVPLITCDGAGQMGNGFLNGTLPTVNGAVGKDIMTTIDKYHPGGPYFVAEFYPAWFDVWGQRHSRRDYKSPASQLDWMLGHQVSISMYMFHGGTNFSYTNGANTAYGYQPQPTSYDYDAPLGEYGNITPKYMAFREVIQRHQPAGQLLPEIPAPNPIATFAPIQFTEAAPLSAAFARRITSERPLTMEDTDTDFGYIHYETTLDEAEKGKLTLTELRDYAVILVNGQYVGSLDRRHRQNRIDVDIPAGGKLEILVENVGRVNYGADLLNNLKGITEKVTLNGRELKNWTVSPLPLYNLYQEVDIDNYPLNLRKFMKQFKKAETPTNKTEAPTFFRGDFKLEKAGDLFLDLRGWIKGAVWVNGHSIGKYWNIGPHQTLYVPGPWVKKGKNEIVIFEMEGRGQRTIAGIEQPILDQVGEDLHQPQLPQRQDLGTPVLDEGDCLLKGEMKLENGKQTFMLHSPATLRHLCLEVTSGYDNEHSCLSEITLLDANGKPLSKDNWSITYANTEEQQEGPADYLIDGHSDTYWHSAWTRDKIAYPHRVIIDLGEITTAGGVTIQQRSAGMPGCVKGFKLYGRPQFFLFKKQ